MKNQKAVALAGTLMLAIPAALLVFNATLPNHFDVRSSVVIPANAETIHPYIASFKAWQEWCPWTPDKSPEVTSEYSGPESGVDSRWSFVDQANGSGSLTITSSDPETGITYTMDFEGAVSRNGIDLKSHPEGTEVSMWSRGDIPFLNRWSIPLVLEPKMKVGYDEALKNLKGLLAAVPESK